MVRLGLRKTLYIVYMINKSILFLDNDYIIADFLTLIIDFNNVVRKYQGHLSYKNKTIDLSNHNNLT